MLTRCREMLLLFCHEKFYSRGGTVPGDETICRLHPRLSRRSFASGDLGRTKYKFAGSGGNVAGGWRAKVGSRLHLVTRQVSAQPATVVPIYPKTRIHSAAFAV